MTLKASALKGSSSAGRRESSCSVRGSIPCTAGTSSGLGRKSITASSSGCTPLFLKAEPSRTGVTEMSSVAARSARFSISGVTLRLVLEVGLHQLVVVVGDRVDQLVVVLLGLLDQLGRDLADLEALPEVVGVLDRIHLDQVDDAAELVLAADRQLHRHRARAEAVDHRLDGGEEVGADAVHLVHERDARHGVVVGLAPDRLGLRLDAGDRVEDGDRAVEDAEAALHLDRKVHVPGRIDDVDAEVAPERRRGSRRDRDAALLLLLHPVHRRGALVNLAHLVSAAGVVEDPLGRRGLARVDVGHDPDVPDAVECLLGLGCCRRHGGYHL